MENKIEVGNSYVWELEGHTLDDIFTINKIINNTVHYTYGDGVECSENINSGWFDDAILLKGKVEESAITPSHYNSKSITPLQVIDSWDLDFYLGNTIKYIARYKDKGKPVEDLKKSLNYLQLFIEKLEKDGESK